MFLEKCVLNKIRRLRIIYIWELKHPIWHRTYTVVPALIRIYSRSAVYLRSRPLSSVTMCSGSEEEGDTKKSKGSLIIIIIGRFCRICAHGGRRDYICVRFAELLLYFRVQDSRTEIENNPHRTFTTTASHTHRGRIIYNIILHYRRRRIDWQLAYTVHAGLLTA